VPAAPPPAIAASTVTPEEVEAVEAPRPAPPAPVAQVAAKPAAAKAGAYKIQLVAVRSPDAANKEWDRLRQRNSDLLSGMELTVTKADLGPDKGIYYRLRAGPLGDEDAAKKLCAELTKRKIGCLVVRPGG
jgi:cell division septation protein DedD